MKLAIYGFGNLGRGTELAATAAEDIELTGIFTRRSPEKVKSAAGTPVYSAEEINAHSDEIDVLAVCCGSAFDLPLLSPRLAKSFNIVDSFDDHTMIKTHFDRVNSAAVKAGTAAVISAGWDPGLFSLARLYARCILPAGETYTFWGRGVSQGHSDAVRHISGVRDARAYTVPCGRLLRAAENGEKIPTAHTRLHTRECVVVASENADRAETERQIRALPHYFYGYDTSVKFISAEEMKNEHGGLPHGGEVIRNGSTGKNGENTASIKYTLKLGSNPEFTGSVMCAFARAAYRLSQNGETGCKTAFDIPPAYLLPLGSERFYENLL